jgi:hypothetical protein
MATCTCLATFLHVSEQLNQIESNLTLSSPDQILVAGRQASAACQQFALCAICGIEQPTNFQWYTMLLSRAVTCYNHFLDSPSQHSSPAAISTASSGSSGWYGGTSVLRIGAFEVEASLDAPTLLTILRAEVRRAAETAALLDACTNPGSLKRGLFNLDAETRQFYQSLVAAVCYEIASLNERLTEG